MASHLDLEEQEQLEALKAFWKQWGNLISWGLTAVLLAYASWVGWNWWQRDQGAKASALYEQLSNQVEAGDVDKATAAFAVLKERFPSTVAAAQGALLQARLQHDKQNDDGARATLAWAAQNAGDALYQDLARLRLAGLQIDAKQLDEAGKTLDAVKAADFSALVADRRGDIAVLQSKPEVAKAEYLKAYQAMDKTLDYRQLVEAKLASLGAAVPEEAAAEAGKESGKESGK